jgi:hypothetical protein
MRAGTSPTVFLRRETMMNGVSRALVAVAAVVPGFAMAQQSAKTQSDLNYTYVEAAYDTNDFNDIDATALTVSGSFKINRDWHVYASYSSADLDFGIDVDTLAVGAGYRYAIKNNVDLYGRVLYLNSDVHVPGPGDGSDDGLGLQFRIRSRINQQLEVEGGIQYLDVNDSDTSLQANVRYHFTNQFSAGIGLTFGGDSDGIGINARYSF